MSARAPRAPWHLLEDDTRGRWVLDFVTDATHEPLPVGMGVCGAPLRPDTPLCVRAISEAQGFPTDITMTPGGLPVVEEHIAAVIEALAGDDVRLHPVSVSGTDGQFLVLEILAQPTCLHPQRTRVIRRNGGHGMLCEGDAIAPLALVVDEATLVDHHIVRSRTFPGAVLVSAPLRDALEAECVSGVRWVPVAGR